MADKLLESYNPLYDVHLQQYFAMPHMQKHLRNLGLMEGGDNKGEVYARHRQMIDVMLKNREQQLFKLAELQKKLDAAEKVEIYRRIRSGQSPETYRRAAKPSRSLSRGRRSVSQSARVRRSSASTEDKDVVAHVEKEREQDIRGEAPPRNCYARLSANTGKYRYLHKLDDNTLISYKDQLRRQLDKLERFREVTFGVHSVARTQPQSQQSWFFRRRSIMNMRGRKTAPTQRNLGESYSSRVSCPPAIRKRRSSADLSTTRLPLIARQAAPKTSPAVKNTLPKLPATTPKRGAAASQPPRGRSSGPVRVSTRTTPETDTKLPPISVVGGAAAAAVAAGAAAAAAMVVSPKGSEDDDRSRGYQSASPEPARDGSDPEMEHGEVEAASEKTASPPPEREEEEEEHHERGKRSIGDHEEEAPEPTHEEEEDEITVQHVAHDEAAIPEKEPTPEPVKEASPEPEPRTPTPEPAVDKEPSPEPSPEPKSPTPEPVVERDPTPEPVIEKEATPEPEEPSPEPKSPSPEPKDASPEPEAVVQMHHEEQSESIPEPVVERDPTPEPKEASPEPAIARDPTPEEPQEPTPEPVVEKEPSPEPKSPSPEPAPKEDSPEPEALMHIHHEVHTEPEPVEEPKEPTPEPVIETEPTPEPKEPSPEPVDEVLRMAPPEIVESLVESERDDDSMITSVYQPNDIEDDVDAELEAEVLRSPTPEPVGDVIEHAGDVNEHAGDVIEHAGDVVEHAGDVVEHAGDVVEHAQTKEDVHDEKTPTPEPAAEPEAVERLHHEVHAEPEPVEEPKEKDPTPEPKEPSPVPEQEEEEDHMRGKRSVGEGDEVSEHHYEMPDESVEEPKEATPEPAGEPQVLQEHHASPEPEPRDATPEPELVQAFHAAVATPEPKEPTPEPEPEQDASPLPAPESPKAASPVEQLVQQPSPEPKQPAPEPATEEPHVLQEQHVASPEPQAPRDATPVEASAELSDPTPEPVMTSPEPSSEATESLPKDAESESQRTPSPKGDVAADESQHSDRDVSSPMSVDSTETDGLKDEEVEEESEEAKKRSESELANNGNASPLDSQPDIPHPVDAAHPTEA